MYANKINIMNNDYGVTSAILESIHWMQTAYAVLCQPQYWANSVMKWVTLNLLKVRAGYWNPLSCSQDVYVMLVYF